MNTLNIVFYSAIALLVLAFISLGLGLSATAIEAAVFSLVVFIVYSFLE